MPAFTFEKIAPPARTAAPAQVRVTSKKSSIAKSRTFISDMLDRFAIARLKREQADLPPTLPRKPPPD